MAQTFDHSNPALAELVHNLAPELEAKAKFDGFNRFAQNAMTHKLQPGEAATRGLLTDPVLFQQALEAMGYIADALELTMHGVRLVMRRRMSREEAEKRVMARYEKAEGGKVSKSDMVEMTKRALDLVLNSVPV